MEELGGILLRAGELARTLRPELTATLKPDGSIVTNVDVAVEEMLRAELVELEPETNVWGEELGLEPEGPRGVWAVDPIDGTSNFRFGSPLWGISVGLIRQERAIIGGIYLPDLDELYLAAEGKGTTMNGKKLPMIPPGAPRPEELISYGDYVGRMPIKIVGKQRTAGAFVIDGAWVATQRYRGLVGRNERLYDIAAALVMCRELGADVRMLDNTPFEERDYMQNQKISAPWIIYPADSGLFSA